MSGIYIPGMEMPTGCEDCPLNFDATCNLIPFGKPDETNGSERRSDCQLIPVPEHGRLIDADALKVSLAFAEKTAEWAVPALRAVLMVIDEMPTIIPADFAKDTNVPTKAADKEVWL